MDMNNKISFKPTEFLLYELRQFYDFNFNVGCTGLKCYANCIFNMIFKNETLIEFFKSMIPNEQFSNFLNKYFELVSISKLANENYMIRTIRNDLKEMGNELVMNVMNRSGDQDAEEFFSLLRSNKKLFKNVKKFLITDSVTEFVCDACGSKGKNVESSYFFHGDSDIIVLKFLSMKNFFETNDSNELYTFTIETEEISDHEQTCFDCESQIDNAKTKKTINVRKDVDINLSKNLFIFCNSKTKNLNELGLTSAKNISRLRFKFGESYYRINCFVIISGIGIGTEHYKSIDALNCYDFNQEFYEEPLLRVVDDSSKTITNHLKPDIRNAFVNLVILEDKTLDFIMAYDSKGKSLKDLLIQIMTPSEKKSFISGSKSNKNEIKQLKNKFSKILTLCNSLNRLLIDLDIDWIEFWNDKRSSLSTFMWFLTFYCNSTPYIDVMDLLEIDLNTTILSSFVEIVKFQSTMSIGECSILMGVNPNDFL